MRASSGNCRDGRLCMVVHGPYPIGEPRVAREVAAAVAAGWDVDVIALRRRGEAPEEIGAAGERVHRLPFEHRRGGGALAVAREYICFSALAAIHLLWLSRRAPFRIVQVHNPPDFLLLAVLPCRWLFRSRIVFDVHDLAPDMFAMRFGERRWSQAADHALRVFELLAVRLADEVVTVHEPYASVLRERGAEPGRLTVVMNSVDPAVLPGAQPVSGAGNTFRVVYHGTVTPSYGVDLLVEAAALAHNDIPVIVLEIYGEGDALPSLRERVRELGLENLVWFHDHTLPQCDVLARVAGASVGVVPNRPSRLNRYALSSKLLEYIALGIPAVVARLPTLEAHFSDQEVAFFSAGDAVDLARVLVELARNPKAAEARAAAARDRATAYGWAENARRYLAVLERVSSPSRRGAHGRAHAESKTIVDS